jgi:Tol biopolymer transport system component
MKLTLALAAAVLLAVHASTAPGPTPVSLQHRASVSGSGNSFAPVFSENGRSIVFVSQAKDLASNGVPSSFLDLFVRDVPEGRTSLVTVNTNGFGGGDSDSSFASITADGRYIAFESTANNLAANDTNGLSDVFLRDLVNGTTRLLSIKTNSMLSGSGHSQAPRITADGRLVIFESLAWNLVTNDFNGPSNDVFVCDLPAGTIRLVSVNNVGTGSPIGQSDSPSMSADGRYVAFRSLATNVVAATSNGWGEVFIRDLDNQVTIWASSSPGDPFTGGFPPACSSPAISLDGRYVVYTVREAYNLSSPRFLRRFELATGLTVSLTNDLGQAFSLSDTPPIISPNGTYVAYETGQADRWVLANVDLGTFETVTIPGLTIFRAPSFSADGNWLVFLGAVSADGPWFVHVRNLEGSILSPASLTTNGAPAEVSGLSLPAVSADGQLVTFESAAANLVADDLNQATDIFLRDLNGAETQLISGRAAGLSASHGARGASLSPRSVSEAGRFIAFTSLDNQLAEGDDNPWQSAFVRDTLAGTNQVLRLPGPSPLGPLRLAFSPVLSVDGRYAAWFEHSVPQFVGTAMATNILWLDWKTGNSAVLPFGGAVLGSSGPAMSTDGRWIAFEERPSSISFTNVYLRDMLSAETSNQLVSVNRVNTAPGDGPSFAPMISPDRRWIAFLSRARDLTTNVSPSVSQVFVRDMLTDLTHLGSTDSTGRNGLPGECSNPMFSADSRCLFFFSKDTLSPSNILFRQVLADTNRNEIVCAGCSNPSASADGRFVAFEFRPVGGVRDVYVRDMRDRTTALVTTNVSLLFAFPPGGDRNSYSPQISYDGRYIVFASQARNLVPDDTNNFSDVFVYDRIQRATITISVNRVSGSTANSLSTLPVMAPDGRTIVFASFAADLAPGDFNNARDVYVLRLGGPDTDEDRLDDDWEVTYFGNLDHDGTSDSDGDGWTDWQEFNTGTDPTNSGSIFRVLTVDMVGGITRTVYWSSVPGRTYRVQVKFDLNDSEWQYLPGRVTATGTTASFADHGSTLLGPPRFYRVELEQ